MKTKTLLVTGLLSLAALSTQAGVGVGISVNVPVPPPPMLPPPPPPIVAPAPVVPDSYVYDGTEYVGVVGGSYYYMGPNNVWLAFGPPQFAHFNAWQGVMQTGGHTPFTTTGSVVLRHLRPAGMTVVTTIVATTGKTSAG